MVLIKIAICMKLYNIFYYYVFYNINISTINEYLYDQLQGIEFFQSWCTSFSETKLDKVNVVLWSVAICIL